MAKQRNTNGSGASLGFEAELFKAADKRNGKFRDRSGEILFIDARKLGHMVDRTRREFSDEDIQRIAGTYHAWRRHRSSPSPPAGEGRGGPRPGEGDYRDIPGFCKSATLEEIRSHGHVLTPGRYVGAEAAEEDDTPFPERCAALQVTLDQLLARTDREEALSRAYLQAVAAGAGYVVSTTDFDRDGIDCDIKAGGRMRPTLGIQLKATIGLGEAVEGHYRYPQPF